MYLRSARGFYGVKYRHNCCRYLLFSANSLLLPRVGFFKFIYAHVRELEEQWTTIMGLVANRSLRTDICTATGGVVDIVFSCTAIA